MGTGRDSKSAARESAPSSLKRPRKPKRRQATVLPHGLAPSTLDDVCFQLLEARSILACAARCLDEIVDAHVLETPEQCHPLDVAVIVRLGIVKLGKVQEVLEAPPVEGKP